MDYIFFGVGLLVLNFVFWGLLFTAGKKQDIIKSKIYGCFSALLGSIIFAYLSFCCFNTEGILSSSAILYLVCFFGQTFVFVESLRYTLKLIDRNCKNK